jgi:uncharacterized cupin superfamily protein
MTGTPKKPAAINPWHVDPQIGTNYPSPHDLLCSHIERRVLGDRFGLTQFGVNLVRLPAGQASAQRHWHRHEDEFVMVLRGTLTLITDAGEQEIGPGMVAGFKAGVEDGHHLVNKSDQDAVYLEIGTRASREECIYPDIDLHYVLDVTGERYTRKDGTPFDE